MHHLLGGLICNSKFVRKIRESLGPNMAYMLLLLLAAAFGQPVSCNKHQTFLSTKVMPVDAFKVRNSLYITVTLVLSLSMFGDEPVPCSKKCGNLRKRPLMSSCTRM